MIDALASPSTRTLCAYGLGRRTILMHAFRAAALPLVSYLGPAAGLMTGSVVVETIFDIRGLGRYFVEAALNRDYPLAMGVAYALIDPRVGLE